ncbi:MAG: hypothetical protein J6O73_05340 [Lachnospiraceae bacterium]|nr:hypothetical protein [Lachnospiraceae bacterium]
MTTKRFPMYRDLLNLSMLYMLLISGFMVLAINIHIAMQPLEFIGTGVVLICCYLMREHVRRLWVYALLHSVLIGACLLVPMESTGKLRLMIMAVVMFLLDLHNWINHEKSVRDLHPGLGLLFLPVLLYTSSKAEYGYAAAVYYMGITFAVLFLIRSLIKNFYELSQSGQLDDDMPVKEIFRNNAVITALIITFVIGGMLFIRSERLILALKRMAYALWGVIVHILSGLFEGRAEEEAMPAMQEMDYLLQQLAREDSDGGLFTLILQVIEAGLFLLFFTIIIYGTCKMVIFLVRALLGKREKRTRRYKSYQLKNEVRQSIREEAINERRRGIFRTPYEKFRELYKKEIKKYKKAGADIRNSKTPEENRKSILAEKGVDLREATDLYEQIRYGTENEVDAKDIVAMKNCIKSAHT